MKTEKLKLAVLRAMDGYDRLGDIGVFERLTKGRRDSSGAFTQGCGLDNGQAIAIVHFLNSGQNSLISRRLDMVCALEETVVEDSGKTAWDLLLDMYDDLQEPKNIGHILDDLVTHSIKKQKALAGNGGG